MHHNAKTNKPSSNPIHETLKTPQNPPTKKQALVADIHEACARQLGPDLAAAVQYGQARVS